MSTSMTTERTRDDVLKGLRFNQQNWINEAASSLHTVHQDAQKLLTGTDTSYAIAWDVIPVLDAAENLLCTTANLPFRRLSFLQPGAQILPEPHWMLPRFHQEFRHCKAQLETARWYTNQLAINGDQDLCPELSQVLADVATQVQAAAKIAGVIDSPTPKAYCGCDSCLRWSGVR
jgi:hypothetical protein